MVTLIQAAIKNDVDVQLGIIFYPQLSNGKVEGTPAELQPLT